MFRKPLYSFAAVTPVLALVACGAPQDLELGAVEANEDALVQIQGESCVTLLAGQTINAGQVCSTIEGDNLKVTYNTANGFALYEAHLWAGLTLASMPQTNSGNPKIGNFPYNSGALAGLNSYSFNIPLSTFGLSSSMTVCDPKTAIVVSHAVVKRTLADGTVQSETAYGEGTRLVQKGNWATWFSLVLTCVDDQPPQPETCETAFAYADVSGVNAACFSEFGFSRWGWSNGPIAAGSYVFDIYAGAGQCDLSKGTYVGQLLVTYDGATAVVKYQADTGFKFEETHLFVGAEQLPRSGRGEFTVAPGQYPYIRDLQPAASTDTYTVTGLSGQVNLVAHAVVCSNNW